MTKDETYAPSPCDCAEFLRFAEELTDSSRGLIRDFRGVKNEFVHKSGEKGVVSKLDLEIEYNWKSQISKRYPDHGIVGEETISTQSDSEFVWLLDPIDGTDDLIRGIPLFGSIISLLYKGDPIVGVIDHPELNVRYSAARGLGARRNGVRLDLRDGAGEKFGSAVAIPAYADFRNLDTADSKLLALIRACPNYRVFRNVYGHTLTMSGQLSACLEIRVSPWDVLASQIIIEEAHGRFCTVESTGRDYRHQKITAIFGYGAMVENIMSAIYGLS